jgi:biopolymer transport protein ExbB
MRSRSPLFRLVVYGLLTVALMVFVPWNIKAQTSPGGQAEDSQAEKNPDATGDETSAQPEPLDVHWLIRAGGAIGLVTIGLSVAMVALIVEHLITIRRGALMPGGVAEEVHRLLLEGQFRDAQEVCQANPSFLGHVLAAGVSEAELDYSAVEKAMEEAAIEQSARLFRKIEFLNVIGTLAPMLGLMGTVWGMILAFNTFQYSTNPQVSELAPHIATALVTTLFGLLVAVPAIAAFAMFRHRIDELVAESSLLAEHVFADYKRNLILRKKAAAAGKKKRSAESASSNAN